MTDILPWLQDNELQPGEVLLLFLFLFFLGSLLQGPQIWEWVRQKVAPRKKG